MKTLKCHFCDDIIEDAHGVLRGFLEVDGKVICSDCLVEISINQGVDFESLVKYEFAKEKKKKPILKLL